MLIALFAAAAAAASGSGSARATVECASAAIAAGAALPIKLAACLGHAAAAVVVLADLTLRTVAALHIGARARVLDAAAVGAEELTGRRWTRLLARVIDADFARSAHAAGERAAAAIAQGTAGRVLELAAGGRAGQAAERQGVAGFAVFTGAAAERTAAAVWQRTASSGCLTVARLALAALAAGSGTYRPAFAGPAALCRAAGVDQQAALSARAFASVCELLAAV
jgi:hypothetical protein